MGYKLWNVKASKGNGAVGEAIPTMKAWVAQIATFDNMTLNEQIHVGNNYYARFNDNALTVYQQTFGTARKGTTNYSHVGLNMSMFAAGSGAWSMISDEETNELVYASMFRQSRANMYSNFCVDGFLFTNGGVMNPLAPEIYSMAATPAEMANCQMGGGQYSFTSGITLQSNAKDLEIFKSDMMCVTTGNEVQIRDHVNFLISYQKQLVKNIGSTQNWIDQFEHLAVKNEENGVDIYYNIGGAAWIKIDSEEDVDLNVDDYT